jgi:K+-sensing histidine kinase KdpD
MAEDPIVSWNRAVLVPLALLVPLAVCALLSIWTGTLTTTTDVLILVALVVAASATGDRVVGITAALSSGVWFDFFLTQPQFRFDIANPDDLEATILLVVIGLLVTEVALWGYRQQARASRRSGYLDGILSTAELGLEPHESVDDLGRRVADQIADVLEVSHCRFVRGSAYDRDMAVLDHRGHVIRHGHEVDVDRKGLPTNDETVLLVRRADDVVGYFVLTSAADVARPSLEQRRVAVLLADQVASLLGRQRG